MNLIKNNCPICENELTVDRTRNKKPLLHCDICGHHRYGIQWPDQEHELFRPEPRQSLTEILQENKWGNV